eukprot:114901-Pyramimonas_sp.AAC.1
MRPCFRPPLEIARTLSAGGPRQPPLGPLPPRLSLATTLGPLGWLAAGASWPPSMGAAFAP